MVVYVNIKPATLHSGDNAQPCGESDRFCWLPGTNVTTGLCGTWLGKENYCCIYTDSSLKSSNACATIKGIHDSTFATFGTAAIIADECPNKAESVINKLGGYQDQCCPYDDYSKLDDDIAAVYFYEAPDGLELSSNLTGIRCLNLTTQGTV